MHAAPAAAAGAGGEQQAKHHCSAQMQSVTALLLLVLLLQQSVAAAACWLAAKWPNTPPDYDMTTDMCAGLTWIGPVVHTKQLPYCVCVAVA